MRKLLCQQFALTVSLFFKPLLAKTEDERYNRPKQKITLVFLSNKTKA